MIKLIIAGSRGIGMEHEEDHAIVSLALEQAGWQDLRPDEVISGMCPDSPDMLGVAWAARYKIPLTPMPAAWIVNGRKNPKAGNQRNVAMAKVGTHLLAIWDGYSDGTKHMIQAATSRGLQVYVHKQELSERRPGLGKVVAEVRKKMPHASHSRVLTEAKVIVSAKGFTPC